MSDNLSHLCLVACLGALAAGCSLDFERETLKLDRAKSERPECPPSQDTLQRKVVAAAP